MRKKYLSALLFGALLFASAGTFTSCKDYDDDINNLQEQINTINTTLADLKNQISDKGVSSVTFDETTGVLTVVDGNGTNSYKITTDATVMVEAEIKDGKLYVDGKEIGTVVGEVTVTDGKLMVDGKEVASLGGENNVVLVKNADAQTCTLTVGDQTVTLPLAATSLIVTGNGYDLFTAYGVWNERADGIRWATAAADLKDWKGPKGPIAQGDFLTGVQNVPTVTVTPAAYDLGASKLALVDVNGETAPVSVVAKRATITDITSGSRAADPKGKWKLYLTFTDDVTADNASTIFTAKENGAISNKLYALTVDGVKVTGYTYRIDTNEKASKCANSNVDYKKMSAVKSNGQELQQNQDILDLTISGRKGYRFILEPNSTYELTYNDPNAYDYRFYFVDADVNDAEAAGIKLDNNVITTSNAAPDFYEMKLDVVYVDGTQKTLDQKDFFAEIYVGQDAAQEEVTAANYVLNADLTNNFILVDLGTTFSSLSASDAVYARGNWEIEAQNELGDYCPLLYVNTVKYYSDEACQNEVSLDDNFSNVKTIKYAKIAVTDDMIATSNTDKVAPGTYNFKLNIYGNNGKLKEVTVPVTISAPKFTDLFATNANWKDNVLTLPISSTGNVDMSLAYNPSNGGAFDRNLSVTFSKINNSTPINVSTVSENTAIVSDNVLTFVSAQQGQFQIATNVIDNNALKTLTAEAAYKVHGFENFTVKSGEFTVKFANPWEGAKLVYYKDGKEVTPLEITGTETKFNVYAAGEKKQGIALVLNGDNTLAGVINGVQLNNSEWKSSFGSAVPTTANATATVDASGNVTVTMGNGASTAAGYTSTMTLKYPVVKVNGSNVYATMTVNIKVNQF